eukprot:gene16817-biopygen25739
MHMVTHAQTMDSYSYDINSDNTLYPGDVNLLHKCIQDLPAQDNFSSVLTWGKEQGLLIRVTLTPRSMGEVLDPRSMEHSGASLHLSHPLVTPSDPIRPMTDAYVCILPSIQGTYSLYSNSYPYLDSCYTSTRLYPPVQGFGLPLDATPSPTPAGDDYEEPQDFFTTQLDDVYWRPGQEFLEGQAAVYHASTSCALPVHLDPSTPASLLPGRLQGGLTICLSHMDPNYLQEGGINNSMPDGAVTPNADRGALHPDCDLFIGHHRDGTEAQRKEMAAMLNRMTPAVARTMEDLREGYKGIVPPMHIEKDNDKQAFTSPYRKPPIEKLAQDKVCAELLLLGFIEPPPSAQHAANPVVALKKGPDGQYTANRVCYNYKAINLLTKDMHTGFPIAEELFQDLGDSKWFTRVDLRSGFYQVHMSAGCQDFSAFWWDKQLYRFKRVPFGLKQAPAYFQKVMETELGKRGLLKFSKVFIDDILVHSATFADHIKDVEAVLQCLIDIGLRIHPDKSCFALDAVVS